MAKINIGIDIGATDAKVVCLESDDGSLRLNSYGLFSHYGDEEKLKDFFAHAGLPKGEVRINIEDPSLKIRRVDLPQMPASEVDEAIKWGLKDIIEGKVEEYAYRHLSIDPEDIEVADKAPYIVFAVKGSAIAERYELARRIGIKRPKIIEPNTAALAVIFDVCKERVRENPQAIIDIGRMFSTFIVMGRKGLVFSRPLARCSEDNMIEQISRDMGMQPAATEELWEKYMNGAQGHGGDGDVRLKNSILQMFSRVAIEVQRSIDGYNLVFGRQKIGRIHICGSGAYYSEMIDYLQQTLMIDVTIFDPFEGIDVREFSPGVFDSRRALFAVACGLAVD